MRSAQSVSVLAKSLIDRHMCRVARAQQQQAQDLKEEQEREARLAQKGFQGFSPRLLSPREEETDAAPILVQRTTETS